MKKINTDFQGWPVEAMTLREILEKLGFIENQEGAFIQTGDPKILDSYPRVLIDDGMGYGADNSYIVEADTDINKDTELGESVFNIWREKIQKKTEDTKEKKKSYVYIVECSSGEYDDYSSWVGCICSTKEKAEKEQKDLDYLHAQGKNFDEISKIFDDLDNKVSNKYSDKIEKFYEDKTENKELEEWMDNYINSLKYEEMHNLEPKYSADEYRIYEDNQYDRNSYSSKITEREIL